jgi:hypothetical protein
MWIGEYKAEVDRILRESIIGPVGLEPHGAAFVRQCGKFWKRRSSVLASGEIGNCWRCSWNFWAYAFPSSSWVH